MYTFHGTRTAQHARFGGSARPAAGLAFTLNQESFELGDSLTAGPHVRLTSSVAARVEQLVAAPDWLRQTCRAAQIEILSANIAFRNAPFRTQSGSECRGAQAHPFALGSDGRALATLSDLVRVKSGVPRSRNDQNQVQSTVSVPTSEKESLRQRLSARGSALSVDGMHAGHPGNTSAHTGTYI